MVRFLFKMTPFFFIILILSCIQNENKVFQTEIPHDITHYLRHVDELPKYYPERISSTQVDLRLKDLSRIDLTGREYDLLHSCFDNYTVWPETLPDTFSPDEIIGKNLNPGMNIRKLHEKGITGKGIKIAIIDQYHKGEHVEFKERITFYGEYIGDHPKEKNSLHGPAVSSIAAGKNLGVAPESEIIYISALGRDDKGIPTCEPFIKALQDIGEYNQSNSDKIDVLSLSLGANPDYLLYDEYITELENLEKMGLTIISVDMYLRNDSYHFYGLEKDPMDDPDDITSYNNISWENWIIKIHKIPKLSELYEEFISTINHETMTLLIPLDGSTIYAGYAGDNHYIYKFVSGMSWCPPYLTGLFALCKQVDTDITLDEFWRYSYLTGKKYQFQANGKTIFGSIVQPEDLIEYIQEL